MSKVSTTQDALEKELPDSGRIDYPTTKRGLTLRVSASGKRQWRYVYNDPFALTDSGRPKRGVLVLGDPAEVGFGAAGDALDTARQRLSKGEPPTPPAQGGGGGTPTTMADLIALFIHELEETREERSAENAARILRLHVLPVIGNAKLAQLNKAILQQPHKKLRGEKLATAHLTWSLIKQMMAFAEDNDYIDRNLLAGMTKDRAKLRKMAARKRVLSAQEITQIANAVDSSRICTIKQSLFKLLLLTGLRTCEIRKNEWANVDWDAATLTVPVSLQKTRNKVADPEDQTVPLSAPAMAILRRLYAVTGDTGFITGDPTTGQPLARNSLYTALKRVQQRVGMEPFCVHDLRRTARSLLTELGVPFDIAEECLLHCLPTIAATYARGDTLPARREAMGKLAAHLSPLMNLPTGQLKAVA